MTVNEVIKEKLNATIKHLLLMFFVSVSMYSSAQLTIVIESLPENTPDNSIVYLAGNINQWNPANKDYQFVKGLNDHLTLRIDSLYEGDELQFKFTLGTWGLVELDNYGIDKENRSIIYTDPDTLYVSIAAWNDPQVEKVIKSTASYNVEVISDSFYMPQLDQYRRIWIYLPPDYDFETATDYPVLYMQDGQNLFDGSTAFSGEWEVDESLNELFEIGATIPIIIGIDHGGVSRINEYSMVDSKDPPIDAQGEQYLDFIIYTLKPYVDSHYRTKPKREYTGIMGSSVGGLISTYAILYHGDVFSLAGIFSPSYWLDDSIYALSLESLDFRIYQLCGTEEGESTIANISKMDSVFVSQSSKKENIRLKIVKNGKHNEELWKNEFTEAILFLFKP